MSAASQELEARLECFHNGVFVHEILEKISTEKGARAWVENMDIVAGIPGLMKQFGRYCGVELNYARELDQISQALREGSAANVALHAERAKNLLSRGTSTF